MSPGEYEISLKTSGKHIHGSPFNTKISGLVLFNANIVIILIAFHNSLVY